MNPFDCDVDSDAPRGLSSDQYSSIELGKFFGCFEPEEPMEHPLWSGPKGIPIKFAVESNLLPIEQNIAPVHPTAEELVAGIEKAGREGRIPAWRDKGRTRYFEPDEQSDGSWLTCCPAHDDHSPSFVASDAEDENGKPKLLIYCRSFCGQDKVIEALDGLGLWNCTPEMIDQLKAQAGVGEARPAPRTAKPKSEAIVPVPASAPLAPDYHPQLGPITKQWPYLDANREVVFFVCRFDPNPTWTANFTSAPKGKVEKPDDKTFRPLSYCKFEDGSMRWHWVAPRSHIPLYEADRLAANPTARVIVCEGEKATRAAQKLFADRVATTWYSGAKAVRKAPWGPSAGAT